ncbi:hypothetical protein [Streptomyces sp. NPDC007346]|uniref:hypothetical protein n=1 Tax=Streptomyces sp. NPDC007346 TaxID=3154682 RepID=UPI003451FE11
MAATTGRAVPAPAAPAAVGVAENPSAAPVLTFSPRPESRVRDRWTVGDSGTVPVGGVAAARAPARLGPMFRIRTGAGGEAGEAAAAGADPPVPTPAPVPVPVDVRVWARSPSTARCTGAGEAAEAGAGADRTGISEGVLGEAGGVVARGGALRGAGAPEGPGCVRRRSPRSGASRWTRAVDGSEVRGVPIPPRARAREPVASAGCGGPEASGRGAWRDAVADDGPAPAAGAFWTGAGAGAGGACPGGGVAAGEAVGAAVSGV